MKQLDIRKLNQACQLIEAAYADAAFAAAYQQRYGDRTIRLVNQADLVPKLPEDFPGLPELHHVVPALAFNADHGDIAARHALATYQNNLWQFA